MANNRQDAMPNGRPVPEGVDFFALTRDLENRCETETDERIPQMGTRAPKCYEQLGTVLSLLDRLSSCWWGCAKGQHIVEYLTGRATSNARAAIRLMKFGFYDEALILARAIGETCNLLMLFTYDRDAMNQWRSAATRTERDAFLPISVRKRLEQLAGRPLILKDRYKRLSGIAAHPDPSSSPQAYNVLGVPLSAGVFQPAGFLVTLNEIALAISGVALFSSLLVPLDSEVSSRIQEASKELVRYLGRVNVVEIDQYWETARSDLLESLKTFREEDTAREGSEQDSPDKEPPGS
jgi:hypothetical protein